MKYDFIEIGTSDFETIVETAQDYTVGISVEPIKYYLERLPTKVGVKKILSAISNYSGKCKVYYIEEEDIRKYNLPHWIRGCNSINDLHLQHKIFKMEDKVKFDEVPVMTLEQLFLQNNVTELDFLKLDTEGHDCIILQNFYTWCINNVRPKKILFESNILSTQLEIQKTILLYSSHYKVIDSTDNTLLELLQTPSL